MQKDNAITLLASYKAGTCSAEEQALVETFYNQYDPQKAFDLTAEELAAEMERLAAGLPLYRNTAEVEAQVKSRGLWPRIGVVAAVLLLAGAGVWFYNTQYMNGRHPELVSGPPLANDVAPGKNTATLTLADGKVVQLSDAKTGLVIDARSLKYSDGSEVNATSTTPPSAPLLAAGGELHDADSKMQNFTVSTPRGGTYQVTLPDGSKVWLNAASSLKFPASFKGAVNRMVELSGEAYLEIAKDKKHPFVVKTATQEVEVLGTHFNISAYADEGSTKTTLVEGRVRVYALSSSQPIVLKPNQQSINSGNAFKIKAVDTESIVAWKNGLFLFYNVDMKTIMRQISRWYDVEVDMATVPDKEFYGEISRNVPLSQVLTMLETASKLKFKTEGRRIMVQH